MKDSIKVCVSGYANVLSTFEKEETSEMQTNDAQQRK